MKINKEDKSGIILKHGCHDMYQHKAEAILRESGQWYTVLDGVEWSCKYCPFCGLDLKLAEVFDQGDNE